MEKPNRIEGALWRLPHRLYEVCEHISETQGPRQATETTYAYAIDVKVSPVATNIPTNTVRGIGYSSDNILQYSRLALMRAI